MMEDDDGAPSKSLANQLQSWPSVRRMFSNMGIPPHSTSLTLAAEPHCGNAAAGSRDSIF